MHRETFIAKLTEVRQTVDQLLAQLQASEHDKFAAHLYRSRQDIG
jgi:membrane-bound lytic murein transglycosylase MltF